MPSGLQFIPVPARVAKARHDLRNPLGEIIGFAEILGEEAPLLAQPQLQPAFAALCADASALLKEINETLELDNLRNEPASVESLRADILAYGQRASAAAGELRVQCGRLPDQPFLDDLGRITTAACHLTERAPLLLADLYERGRDDLDLHAEGRPDDGFESGISGDTIFLRRPATISATDSTGTTFRSRTAAAPVQAAAILVVDDNEANRALLTRRLVRNGHTVAHADDGQRALEMVRQHPFDLVLLDVLMPNLTGHEVLAEMKADPALRHIPVIMITGFDDLDSLVRCIEGGAEDYLTKPFDPVLLNARIGACLEKKRLRDREREHLAEIEEQRRRADELLRVILPHSVALELKETNAVKPRQHPHVAVLFSDVVGFTAYCDKHPAEEVIVHLQALVQSFEEIAARHGLEKIKTIGDAFMATAGLIEPVENPALQCVRAGLEMVRAARALPSGWDVHVGIHTGPVISGVVGQRKYLFDVWGDTVNTASRMVDLAGSGAVCLSEHTWREVASHCIGVSTGTFQVKGKGEIEVFRVDSAA